MSVTGNNIVTPQGVRSATAICTAAKTTYNDSVNAQKILTPGANGSIVYGLKAVPRGTITATQTQLYRSPDNGLTMIPLQGPLMGAYTMAQTTALPVTDMGYAESVPLRIGPSETLWVAIGVALAAGVAFDCQVEDL